MSVRQRLRPASPGLAARLAGSGGRERRARRRSAAGPAAPSSRPAGLPWPTVVARLPAYLDESNAAAVRASLLAASEHGPRLLIADMSATRWCDWAGAGALASAFGGALAAGTELRLVVTDESVRRVISLNGLDRMMSVYRDLTDAWAAAPGGQAME